MAEYGRPEVCTGCFTEKPPKAVNFLVDRQRPRIRAIEPYLVAYMAGEAASR
jgi:hypothetical protein